MVKGRDRWWRRHGAVLAGIAGLACALAVALVLGTGNGGQSPVHHTHSASRTAHRQYVRVLSALATTTDASSFDFTFAVTDTPGSQPPLKFDGQGVVNTNPY